MYTLPADGESLYEVAISIMEESRSCFSVILDRESKLPEEQRQWITGRCPSWLRLKGELRRSGNQAILGEIISMEAELLSDNIERELYEAYNDGDVGRVELAAKTLSSVINKMKMNSGKLDGDVKRALVGNMLAKERDKLKAYSDDELRLLLKKTKDEADGDK